MCEPPCKCRYIRTLPKIAFTILAAVATGAAAALMHAAVRALVGWRSAALQGAWRTGLLQARMAGPHEPGWGASQVPPRRLCLSPAAHD